MTDVFISYASADRDKARLVAQALRAKGWSVWWDRVIPPGKQYDEVIEQALAGAKCVVVLWSPTSAASKWVRIEAGEALRRGLLVPALIAKDTAIPLEFSRVQAADLSQWQAGNASESFEQFGLAIQGHLGPTPKPPHSPPPPAGRGLGLSRKQLAWGGAAALVLVAAGYGGFGPAHQQDPRKSTRQLPDEADTQARPVLSPAPEPKPARSPKLAASPSPSALTSPVEVMDGGIDRDLQWRDHVLAFTGHLRWDGRSPQASLQARAVDSGNGSLVSEGRFVLQMQQVAQGRIVFLMSLGVPGDSHTPGQHAHGMGLIFDRQPGSGPAGWRYVCNCTAPNRPDLCF